jgi:hypothetical protein
MIRKLSCPEAKLRLAAASSSQGSTRCGRLRMIPARMATTPLIPIRPQVTIRAPGMK